MTPAFALSLLLLACAAPRTGALRESFDLPDGLVADERLSISPVWRATSGSLFALGGAGYTGAPEDGRGNNSAVFRVVTRRSDFKDAEVSFRLLVRRLVSSARTPAVDWDGVHVFLRYQSPQHLYHASVVRRDDSVIIKKKTPGGRSNGGTYHELCAKRPFRAPYGSWTRVRAVVRDLPGGAVAIRLYADGRLLAEAVDDGSKGGPPIRKPGRVGLRGDNAEFFFDDFVAGPAGPEASARAGS